jgi:hypothetical protein
MTFGMYLWMTFGIFGTLAIFSFLYKDNPFYKFAEHLVVGVSAGYFVIILWHNGLTPNLFQRLADGDWYFLFLNSSRPEYLIPAFLGALMWTRFSQQYSWLSRWPMAMYIGIATGMAVPLEMANRINKQLFAMMNPIDFEHFFGTAGFDLLDPTSGLSQLIVFVGAMCALIYFYFSKSHEGIFGRVAKIGIYTLMIGFGASFGYTVMARISLFINRIQAFEGWRAVGFDNTNENYHSGFPIIFWVLMLGIVVYAIVEIVQYRNRPPETKQPAA